ncbi:MAG: translation initiation factor IF-2 [Acidimicrobiales bacterium]
MAARIRVYELARELGLTNKETLDLCQALGIGVRSHSSSIEDAQADRVRRKADREGLRRAVAPEEPAPAPAPPASSQPSRPVSPVSATTGPPAASPRPLDPGHRLVTSRPASEQPDFGAPSRLPEPARSVPQPPPARRPAPAPAPPAPSRPVAPTTAPATPARPVVPAASAAPAAPPSAPVAPPSAPPSAGATGPSPVPAGARAPGDKPIPPSPGARPGGPPRSASGKPIPPPPGMGPRSQPPARSAPGGARPGGPTGSRFGGVGARPGGPPRPGPGAGPGTGTGARPAGPAGAGRPGGPGRPGGFAGGPGGGGFPRPGAPGAGGPGRPGGGPPGRGGPGQNRRPPRRRRRRRSVEELQPTQATNYTRSDAPIPEGEIVVERGASAQELGPKLNRTTADVVRFLLQQGEMVTATQSLSDDMIELFAAEIGAEVLLVDPGQEQEVELQEMLRDDDDEEENLRPRPPVITVMGHVDHGKTMLLDRIRETNVVAGEAGGITQHIGAYQADKDGRLVTFIDTPGHEAFTAMRARGAEATDIVVLVVAADDGVMPQTIEALNHARAADVPIVVAINKVDRDNADPTRVRQQLSEQGLVPEEWGGDTIMVEVSALQNIGVEDLLEQLVVVAEIEELAANPEGRARGVVLEANLDVGRGPVATVLVEHGTLRVSDPIVAGAAWGRVRALIDHNGDVIKEAPPSTPVQVLGLSDVPRAGDEFRVAPDDKTARTVAEARSQRYRFADMRKTSSVVGSGARLEDIFEQIQRGETATLNLILKADVHGSLEALTESLRRLERDEVRLAFVHRAVGGITENDVGLASASNATIIGFNVRPDRKARELAEADDVEIRTYQIIYQVLEDIEKAMVGLLKPEFEEVVTGEAEVRAVFRVPKIGAVAGCYVRNGVVTRGSKVRFLREGVVIWTGTLTSLKRFKDDAREVATGFECGIGLSDFQDLKPGDVIETYEEREIART